MSEEFLSEVDQETLVSQVKEELTDLDSLELNDHAKRYEELHAKLNQALSSIDGM